jgi:crotonobetainyl-CoA:carnitine CoA-transferase CaiB-like acyl-CoA transferase
LLPILQEKLMQKSTKEWVEIFEQVKIPSAPINKMKDVFEDPQVEIFFFSFGV